MDLPQIVSVVAVSTLTIVALIIGIQIILLLKELNKSLSRFNQVLDSAETTIRKFSQPITSVAGLVEGIKQSTKIIEIVSNFLNRHRHSSKPPINLPDNEPV